jgi:eukaryotic-like serine/threonine-protein kinase
MTPERWRQLTTIFHGAQARDVTDRNAYLDHACAGDPSLRAEVESLLASQGTLGRGVNDTAALPQLPAGTRLGQYRVDALVGAGGMGQVYRATDTRLRRTVALKLLLPDLSLDPGFGARFEREARVLASLNHPNIAAIHGFEDADGVPALVLEFVEGPTLGDRLAKGPLPPTEALTVARQLARALEAAHDKGIVHRDLKPANIKITSSGIVKVLDFGIARVVDGDGNAATNAGTHTGTILGTPAYMSPEQARGLVVDRRTDIWAFGCVLYEMLTGRGAFAADTASDSLAKVIEREPAWEALGSGMPEPIRRLIKRCLQKDPARRLHDIADARIEIDELLATSAADVVPTAGTPRRGRPWLQIAVAAVVVTAVATAWWFLRRTSSTSPGAVEEFGLWFPENHIPSVGIAVSPNGESIAAGVFGAGAQIYLRTRDSLEPRPLLGTENGGSPFWSPESDRLGFYTFTGSELRTIRPGESSSALVCRTPQAFRGGTWSSDGVIVFAAEGKLFRVSATGGTPEPLGVSAEFGEPTRPQFLPDQRHFLFYALKADGGAVIVGSIDSSEVTRIMHADAAAEFIAPNLLLFVRGTSLMAQRFDPGRRALEGQPVTVATKVTAGLASESPYISASSDVLAFATARGGGIGRLRWVDRTGRVVGEIAPPSEGEYLNPSISPDGKFVAVNYQDVQTGNWDIWKIDVARGVPSRLTTDSASDTDAVWSPDSNEVVFVSNRGGRFGLYRKAVSGSNEERLIKQFANRLIPNDLSREYLLFSQFNQLTGGQLSVWVLPVSGPAEPVRLMSERFTPYAPRLSPDGRWVAYNSYETGLQEINVARFLAPGQTQQISHGGGVHARWTNRGELVYWAVPAGVDAVAFTSGADTFRVGARRTLVQTPILSAIDGRPHYDITRDGTRLLVRQSAGPQGPGIRVILNWRSKLTR